MAILERLVEYSDGESLLEGYMAWDDSRPGPRPGVLVSHAWRGRGPSEEQKARDLAELGYVGFALDMYGKGILGPCGKLQVTAIAKSAPIERCAIFQGRHSTE